MWWWQNSQVQNCSKGQVSKFIVFFQKGIILVSLDTGFILQDNVKLIMSLQHGYGFNMTLSIWEDSAWVVNNNFNSMVCNRVIINVIIVIYILIKNVFSMVIIITI